MIESQALERLREARYAGWADELGRVDPGGRRLARGARRRGSPPARSTRSPCPGRQELLENLVNQPIWAVDQAARVETGARR